MARSRLENVKKGTKMIKHIYLIPYTWGHARRIFWTWLWNRSNRKNIWLRTKMDRSLTIIHDAEKLLGWFCDCCQWDRILIRYYTVGWRKVAGDRLWSLNAPGRVMCLLGFAMMTHKRRPSMVMDNFGIQAEARK